MTETAPFRIAINGYGRIGQCVLRALYENGYRDHLQVVAINELSDIDTIAHLTRYDSTHGRFQGSIAVDGDNLLVNGDLASVVLFGGLLLWALAEIALIEAGGPREAVPPPAGPRKEMMALLGAVVVYGLIGLVHGWVGPWPFGG